jgi:hypothetical protein
MDLSQVDHKELHRFFETESNGCLKLRRAGDMGKISRRYNVWIPHSNNNRMGRYYIFESKEDPSIPFMMGETEDSNFIYLKVLGTGRQEPQPQIEIRGCGGLIILKGPTISKVSDQVHASSCSCLFCMQHLTDVCFLGAGSMGMLGGNRHPNSDVGGLDTGC